MVDVINVVHPLRSAKVLGPIYTSFSLSCFFCYRLPTTVTSIIAPSWVCGCTLLGSCSLAPTCGSPRPSPWLLPYNTSVICTLLRFLSVDSLSPVSYLSPTCGAAWSWLSFTICNGGRFVHAPPVSCGAACGGTERVYPLLAKVDPDAE